MHILYFPSETWAKSVHYTGQNSVSKIFKKNPVGEKSAPQGSRAAYERAVKAGLGFCFRCLLTRGFSDTCIFYTNFCVDILIVAHTVN